MINNNNWPEQTNQNRTGNSADSRPEFLEAISPHLVVKSLPLNILSSSTWSSLTTPETSSHPSRGTSPPSDSILDSNGNSPLTCAVYSNDITSAKNLIEQYHFPLNLQNYEGETALSYAVMNNNYDMVKFLLSRGADLNISNCRTETPLHQAVVLGNSEIVRLLVEAGSFVDAEDECGDTPLHFAVREDQPEIVEFLLEIGADPDHSNQDDETPAELAEIVASDKVKKVFMDNCKRYLDGHGLDNSIHQSLGSKSHLLLQKSQRKLTSSSYLSPLSMSLNIPRKPL
jgi:ankyrin repeat protein